MPTEIKQANMLKEIISNRKSIWDLSKNDFKTRFAGSYLGIIWAFVQPIVTVLVYWFVFEKGMHASGINLRSGIINQKLKMQNHKQNGLKKVKNL